MLCRARSALPITPAAGCWPETLALFTRTLVNTAGNPNVAATLVVGLGCESISAEQAAAGIKKFGKPVEYLSIQQTGGTLKTLKKGIALARKLVEKVNDIPREPAAISDLVLAVECGGSDPASGLSANVALGSAVDKIVDAGGSQLSVRPMNSSVRR